MNRNFEFHQIIISSQSKFAFCREREYYQRIMALAEIHINVDSSVGVDDDVPKSNCDATIELFTDDGILASVEPSSDKCKGCELSVKGLCDASLVLVVQV